MTFASGYQDVRAIPSDNLRYMRSPGAPKRRRILRHPWIVHLVAVVIVVLFWQYLNAVSDRVPSIDSVISFMITEATGGSHGGRLNGEFWSPLFLSLQRYVIGLAIGVPIGAVLGMLIGTSRWARGLLNDTTLVLLSMPAVVWAFMASLWFGLTPTAPVMAVAVTAIPFVAINLSTGVRSIAPGLLAMSRSFRVTRRNQIMDLLVGGTIVNVFTGVRLAFMTGWNSLLIVEWFGATAGVGWRARFWYDNLRYEGFVGLDPVVRAADHRARPIRASTPRAAVRSDGTAKPR